MIGNERKRERGRKRREREEKKKDEKAGEFLQIQTWLSYPPSCLWIYEYVQLIQPES